MSSSQAQVVNKGTYWPKWNAINFPPSAIDTTLFTHVYFAFISPNNTTFTLETAGEIGVLLRDFTTTLKNKNPPVKAMVSIGGATQDPVIFSRLASSEVSRSAFISSVIDVAHKFGFDGVDLDWEFPKTPTDMKNLGDLLKEWRAAVKKSMVPQLLLSAATYYSAEINFDDTHGDYPVASINENLDWINVMCYDYYLGSWSRSTGAHAALREYPNGSGSRNTISGLQSWMTAIPKEKLVMGMPLYGRTWTLQDPSVNGIGAPGVGIGPGDDGAMAYVDIQRWNADNGATQVYDPNTVSHYSYAGSSWIGYDDVKSVAAKVAYARDLKLGGYYFWAVYGDHNWVISRQAAETWGR